jgi:imidazole glycerol-phosphate synthase subunit HisH
MSMITVVDYGAGNIGSVLNMIRKVGGQAVASGQSDELLKAEKILLPGVGSFDNAMSRLKNLALIEVLQERAEAGVPFFGICLGMQLLSNNSEEGTLPGLGLIPGSVRRFKFDAEQAHLKIPHMGWNRAEPLREHSLCKGLENDARFYFVHSYFYECENPEHVLFKSTYGSDFASGIQRENVMGVQFHPEKSHRYGMQLLKNFIEL